jgi:hypothetical protein
MRTRCHHSGGRSAGVTAHGELAYGHVTRHHRWCVHGQVNWVLLVKRHKQRCWRHGVHATAVCRHQRQGEIHGATDTADATAASASEWCMSN